jgi:hypothetical protein
VDGVDDSHSVAAIAGASDAQTPTLSSEVNPLSALDGYAMMRNAT